jgi:hypothetical protein
MQHVLVAMLPDASVRSLRRYILVIFVFGLIGTAADLLLVEHFDGFQQSIPLVLCGLSLASVAWVARNNGRAALRFHQGVMALVIISGFVGLWLHYTANIEFELEMYPDLAGFPLFWKAIQGASPPSLAPGAMMGLGLLGLAYTHHHPAHRDSPGAKS